MSRDFRMLGVLVMFVAAVPAAAQGQEPAPVAATPELGELVGESVRARLVDPSLVRRFDEPLPTERLARLLEGAELRIEAFEHSRESNLALGFSYALAKVLRAAPEEHAPALELVARGHVAFEQRANPEDLLTTVLRARWSGTHTFGTAASRAELARTFADPRPAELSALDPAHASELSTRLARGESPASIRADPAFALFEQSTLDGALRELPPELSWDFDLHLGQESTQDFSSRQLVFGSSVCARLVSWDPDARLSRRNLFDLPAASLRWLAGEDFRLSGEAYPTVVAGLDVVDATLDEQRGALTDTDSFLRARFELGTRSEVLRVADERLHLSAAWSWYPELAPPGAVRAAGTDDPRLLKMELELPRGWSLSFTAGRPPLDAQYESTFALGYRLRL